MTSKELPRLMKSVSYEHASTARNGTYSNFGHASAKYLKEYTAKRARESEDQAIQAGSSARVGLFKRARGCSSKFSTLRLSLEILSGVFSCLHPSDLVSLSRVNKDFRSLLLSHSSSVTWDTCFKLCGAPASPADVSPQAWTHLLFGGAYCYSCGAKPENNILFSSRRRACKSCMTDHLLCSSNVPRGFRDMIRFELGNAGSVVHQQMPCCTRHWWDEDVAAFKAELNVLKYRVGVPVNVLEFLTRKKEEVKVIREHALICAEWDKDRNPSCNPKPSDVGVKHFEDINSPFLQLGYSEGDVDQLRRHREVRVGYYASKFLPAGSGRLLDASARSSYQLQTGSRHEDFALRGDGRLIHDHFKSVMQASPQDRISRFDAPDYRPASDGALQGNGGPDYDHSQSFTRVNSQDYVTQLNASSYHSPTGSAPEASASQYSTLANALSLSITSTQSQDSDDQVDVQPDEATASITYGCPICNRTFTRQQERNRHVESYLPHSIVCSFQGCSRTGRRQWDLKEHWKKTHANSGRVPKKTTEIYDPKKFVESIVDGTPLVEVKRSALLTVQERLESLGKAGERVNVWGRKRKVVN
ncbi:hypothetical protein BGY98DRAFT_938327 [Russula aff. rugulosa BPL654]|nr:hypothetical protein BGY98DRAFT_938327 [Russula aff. rugulosa BPL654]